MVYVVLELCYVLIGVVLWCVEEMVEVVVELGWVNKELEVFLYIVLYDLCVLMCYIVGFVELVLEIEGVGFSDWVCCYFNYVKEVFVYVGMFVDVLLDFFCMGCVVLKCEELDMELLIEVFVVE